MCNETTVPKHVLEVIEIVGERGYLSGDHAEVLRPFDWINCLWHEEWTAIADELSQAQVLNLFRGLVLAERDLEWLGGSAAATVWLYREYVRRLDADTTALVEWLRRVGTTNSFIHIGRSGYPSNRDEHAEMVRWAHKQRVDAENVKERKQCKQRRERERLHAHHQRLIAGERRSRAVSTMNVQLLALQPYERLVSIIDSDFPLEAVCTDVIDGLHRSLPRLDYEKRNQLSKKIDKRRRGIWGRIGRQINETSPAA